MQKSDNQTRNQRSWRTFREQHDPEARRERRGAKKSLPPQEVVPQSPTISTPQPATTLSEAPSPATSEESNSESPGCGQGPKPTHLRQSKKARTEVPPGAAAPRRRSSISLASLSSTRSNSSELCARKVGCGCSSWAKTMSPSRASFRRLTARAKKSQVSWTSNAGRGLIWTLRTLRSERETAFADCASCESSYRRGGEDSNNKSP
jgi:hypothetical protein